MDSTNASDKKSGESDNAKKDKKLDHCINGRILCNDMAELGHILDSIVSKICAKLQQRYQNMR